MVLDWPNFLEYHTKDDSQPARKFNGNTKVISVKSMLTAIENYKNHKFNKIPKEVKKYIKDAKDNNWTLAHSIQNAFAVNLMTKGRDFTVVWILKHSEEYAQAWEHAPYKDSFNRHGPGLLNQIQPNIEEFVYVVHSKDGIKVFDDKTYAFAYYSALSTIKGVDLVHMETHKINEAVV